MPKKEDWKHKREEIRKEKEKKTVYIREEETHFSTNTERNQVFTSKKAVPYKHSKHVLRAVNQA